MVSKLIYFSYFMYDAIKIKLMSQHNRHIVHENKYDCLDDRSAHFAENNNSICNNKQNKMIAR